MTDAAIFDYADPLRRRYRGMNLHELVTMDGLTRKQAKIVMKARVFGTGYKEKDGKPIERGKGSVLQPTQQHLDALRARHLATPLPGESDEERRKRLAQREADIRVAEIKVAEYYKRRLAEIEQDDADEDDD